MEVQFRANASAHDLAVKNQMYNDAAAAIWRLTVYDPVHQGWEFTNIGGHDFLDDVGRRGRLDSRKNVLELCCGLGATCRYIADKFGCPVTGIDLNPFQIDYARRRSEEEYAGTGARMPEFVLEDIVNWQPTNNFDVVFVMDSLTMIDQPQAIINKAAKCLRPNGLLALAEITSGENIDNEVRQTCWEEDGFINLIDPEQYGDFIAETGLVNIEMQDRTDLAKDVFTQIYESLRKQKEEIVASGGVEMYESWINMTRFYLRCFNSRQLTYYYFSGSQRC